MERRTVCCRIQAAHQPCCCLWHLLHLNCCGAPSLVLHCRADAFGSDPWLLSLRATVKAAIERRTRVLVRWAALGCCFCCV